MQDLLLADGRRVYEAAGQLVETWGAEAMGSGSYSNVGAVVGATHKEEGTRLRSQMPHTFFWYLVMELRAVRRRISPDFSTKTGSALSSILPGNYGGI